jgi:hypothetical protein
VLCRDCGNWLRRGGDAGIMPRLVDFAFLMAAVVVLTYLAWLINRLSGTRYPTWAPNRES